MPRSNKLYVIGIGYRPLEERARDVIVGAEVILASSRLLDVFKRYDEYHAVKDRTKIINNVQETIGFIQSLFSQSESRNPRSAMTSIVLLASGDPLFFGIGRRVREVFGDDAIETLPDLSSVQEAFARINEPWDDAFFMSLHGGPDAAKRRKLPYEIADIPNLLENHSKLAILTDPQNNPARIAGILHSALRNPNSKLTMFVCERLGYPEEKITRGAPDQIAVMSFSDPNVVIIQKAENGAQNTEDRSQKIGFRFGLREKEIEHDRGLITKDEVRAVALHKLRLPESGVLWDIGAGSGSVSLEAARLCPGLQVFAIEKEPDRIETIRRNMVKYEVENVKIVQGNAPEGLAYLPIPDRVFIGGSSGNLGAIVNSIKQKMRAGIVVINAVTLDTLNTALPALEKSGFSAELSEISVSRSTNLAGKRQMTALNPVFIIKGERG